MKAILDSTSRFRHRDLPRSKIRFVFLKFYNKALAPSLSSNCILVDVADYVVRESTFLNVCASTIFSLYIILVVINSCFWVISF